MGSYQRNHTSGTLLIFNLQIWNFESLPHTIPLDSSDCSIKCYLISSVNLSIFLSISKSKNISSLISLKLQSCTLQCRSMLVIQTNCNANWHLGVTSSDFKWKKKKKRSKTLLDPELAKISSHEIFTNLITLLFLTEK